jgi:3-oxoacyl-[acyl-carrier protein] reductase
MNRLAGKTAIVTGAGRGIGNAVARRFAEEGAKVVLISRNPASCGAAADAINAEFPDSCKAFPCDVADAAAVETCVKEILAEYPTVDILVNNAGITRDGMFHKMSIDQWTKVIDTNLNGTFYWCHELINQMRDRGYGRIINISSASVRGIVGQTNYAATKAAMEGFTNSLAKEVAAKGITVNCVAPGATKTAMYDAVPEKVYNAMVESNPMKRLGRPEEIGEVIAFVSSERASYLNGQWILVNGGK